MERTPPHSQEAEQGVVAAILLDPPSLDKVHHLLSFEDFYDARLGLIYRAVGEVVDQGLPLSAYSVIDRLKERKELKQVGGTAHVVEIAESGVTSANIEYYARTIRAKAKLRAIFRTCSETAEDILNGKNLDAALSTLDGAITRAQDSRIAARPMEIADLVPAVIERIEKESRGEAQIGIHSGYVDLDHMTGGFQPGQMVIIAARPSMGKTSLGLNILLRACVTGKVPSLLLSLEMPSELITRSMLATESGVPSNSFRRALNDAESRALALAAGKIGSAPLRIEDEGVYTIAGIRAKARRAVREMGARLIAVDYLQLIGGSRAESRNVQVTEYSGALKQLAKELSVPVLVLSQINRQNEGRADRRPRLSDLRDSGAIEQDADLCLLIHRDSYYEEEKRGEAGQAEIIVAKNRTGPVGSINLWWDPTLTKFTGM